MDALSLWRGYGRKAMTDKDTGGPAFPRAGDFNPQIGMTLRDYFAAKAMQAITPSFANANILNPAEFISDKAYALADAMLKAREQ